jgi:hypothetical protein
MYTGTLAAANNRPDWQFALEVIDPETNDPIDLPGATIKVAIRPPGQGLPVLAGSNSDGHVVVTGDGNFNVTFSLNEMSSLAPGSYDVGLTVTTADGLTYAVLANCSLPVVDGVVV